MAAYSFIDKVKSQQCQNLPFVIFRAPSKDDQKTMSLKAYFPKNDHLHFSRDFEESGFVMAPFDLNRQQAVLFPEQECEVRCFEEEPLPHILQTPIFQHTEKELAREQHIRLVNKGISAIKKGDFDKVVLSRCITVSADFDALQLFLNLLSRYPNAFIYYWHHPQIGTWLGATPETLLSISGKDLKTVALASTKPYINGKLPDWSSKEIEEHQYVSDFIIHILKQYTSHLHKGETKSIKAGKLWHLKCNISARMQQENQLKKILAEIHPTPAVCGIPKEEAKRFILANENYDRVFYSGFLGELNIQEKDIRKANRRNTEQQAYSLPKKRSTLYVNLRCLQVKDDKSLIYVGGGIVENSHAENEWQETVNKSKTMLDALPVSHSGQPL